MASYKSGKEPTLAHISLKTDDNKKETRKKRYRSTLHKDVLIFLAYFVNNLLYYLYIVFSYKLVFTTVNYLNYHNFLNVQDLDSKYLEFSTRVLASYTWHRYHSNEFDGDTFMHLFLHRYKIINRRETVARIFGTLLASCLFAKYFYLNLGFNFGDDRTFDVTKDLTSLVEKGNVSFTFLDTFFFDHINSDLKSSFIKNFVNPLLRVSELQLGPNYFYMLERYFALLVEFFLVEFFFCCCVYTLLTTCLSDKNFRKYKFICSICKRTFAKFGDTLLVNLNGKLSLDSYISVCLYYKDGNSQLLCLRLFANLMAAYCVPVFFPMPALISYEEYQDVYVNLSKFPVTSTAESTPTQLVDLTKVMHKACYSRWPDTLLGRVFHKIDNFFD